ncbi:MAG TPA: ABC transporter transmembrane domain-containing protein [Thermoanaerobaculia bacterium]|nr:ABC transporter transmembrane domain-containing protein [Thermoanaerobaculia bacterium]
MKILRRLFRHVLPYRGWAILALASMLLVGLTTGALIVLIQPLFDEVLTRDAPGDANRLSGRVVDPGGRPIPQARVVISGEGGSEAAVAGPSGEFAIAPPSAAPPESDERAKNALIDHLLRRDRPEGERGPIVNRIDARTRQFRSWWDAHEDARWKYILALLMVVFVVRAIASFFSEYSFQKVGLSTVRDLRNALYGSIIGQSNRFFAERSTGELLSRIVSDVEQVQAAVSVRIGDLFQESVNLFVIGGVIVLVNTELAIFTFVIAPLIVVPVVHFGKRLRRATRVSQERMADIATLLEETIKGARIVKAFSMEPFEIRRFREATRRHLAINLKAQRIQALTSPVMELLAGICMVLLFGYAALRIRDGALTLGQFMSFLIALAGMYAPIKRLNKVNLAVNTALSAAERVFDILDVRNEVVERSDAIRIASLGSGIAYEKVGFAYGQKEVLREVSLSVAPGEVVALVGGSGAGKSTLVNLLPRFYDVSAGRVVIDGHDIRDLTLESLRGMIGFVTQEVILFNDTVRNNIAYGRADVGREEIERSARAANAHEFIMQLPQGYDSMIGEGGVLLSGGQRQRLAIARALLKDSPILILDEATSALDTESERLVQQALANLMEGRTTLVIAHRLSTVRNASKIVVLEAGAIVESGTHDELIARKGLYRKLYELQFLEDEAMSEAMA